MGGLFGASQDSQTSLGRGDETRSSCSWPPEEQALGCFLSGGHRAYLVHGAKLDQDRSIEWFILQLTTSPSVEPAGSSSHYDQSWNALFPEDNSDEVNCTPRTYLLEQIGSMELNGARNDT